eukprot:CAMPEP_0116550038 /NCGR_PEP_ID=MMETSP0397-20121206/5209_1 /TAXON_ID=216820 /ORGANISM="Cyclophora tenuis, Strain ECT3854" /LENGTH=98 /DNA_ID=CAMNT_0004074833 /DNA_START=105 /DNA_END=401 /DNA_ORIENTATION=+
MVMMSAAPFVWEVSWTKMKCADVIPANVHSIMDALMNGSNDPIAVLSAVQTLSRFVDPPLVPLEEEQSQQKQQHHGDGGIHSGTERLDREEEALGVGL